MLPLFPRVKEPAVLWIVGAWEVQEWRCQHGCKPVSVSCRFSLGFDAFLSLYIVPTVNRPGSLEHAGSMIILSMSRKRRK
jgi:hypothetical protein